MARQKQSTRSREVGRPQGVVFARFDGINNVEARDKLKPTELTASVNVDLDRDGYPTRRPGRTIVISGSGMHSGWSDGTTNLCVKGGDLCLVDPVNATLTVLRRNVGDAPMDYESVDGMAFYTNGLVIGYVSNGVDYALEAPTRAYKRLPLPGQKIALYNGSIHVPRGSKIDMTDPFQYNEVDSRFGGGELDSYITMYEPLDDGIWASTRTAIWYMSGDEPHKMQYREVSREPNLSGAVAYVDSRLFGGRKDDPVYGKIIVFPTTAGLCWATNGGIFGNITGRKYTLPAHNRGAGVFRSGDINQAIFALQ